MTITDRSKWPIRVMAIVAGCTSAYAEVVGVLMFWGPLKHVLLAPVVIVASSGGIFCALMLYALTVEKTETEGT